MRFVLGLLLSCLLVLPVSAIAEEDVTKEDVVAKEWRFNLLMDGSPIGSQVFRLSREGQRSRVSVAADFDVKILFLSVYTYEHRNEELWEGGCLLAMNSTTDDNGEVFRVTASSVADGLLVETRDGRKSLAGCVHSFAYWDPKHLGSSRLLNPQTGEYEAVRLKEHGTETIAFRGQPTTARRISLEGDKLKIDLWYSDTSDWLALESTTKSGGKLYYQRQ